MVMWKLVFAFLFALTDGEYYFGRDSLSTYTGGKLCTTISFPAINPSSQVRIQASVNFALRTDDPSSSPHDATTLWVQSMASSSAVLCVEDSTHPGNSFTDDLMNVDWLVYKFDDLVADFSSQYAAEGNIEDWTEGGVRNIGGGDNGDCYPGRNSNRRWMVWGQLYAPTLLAIPYYLPNPGTSNALMEWGEYFKFFSSPSQFKRVPFSIFFVELPVLHNPNSCVVEIVYSTN